MAIDVHAHYVSPGLLDQAASSASPVAVDEAEHRLIFPSGPSRPIPNSLLELTERSAWMDRRFIRIQIVSPWMDILGVDLSGPDQALWCRMYNDTVADDLEGAPRFRAMAALPVSSGEWAAEELERAVSELGFAGGAIPTQVGDGLDLDAAGLDALFQAAEALDVPLFIHPYRVMARSRMTSHFLFNVCGNPFETTLAALRLFFSGVFETLPKLRILLAHAGGTLPMLAGRAVHASRHAQGFDRELESSSEILDRFYYDTILHDERALAFALTAIGPERFALGSDYPFPMLVDDPHRHIHSAAQEMGASTDLIKQVAEVTPAQLFRL